MPITAKNKKDIKAQIEIIGKALVSKSIKLEFHDSTLDRVINRYEYIRDGIKSFMQDNIKNPQIDRHKVAATFAIAILKEEPIKKNKSVTNDLSYNERNANIILSYYVSFAIIEDFFYEETKEKLKMILPIESYKYEYQKLLHNNLNLLVSIATNPTQIYANSLFYISHLFFFIEKYSLLKSSKNI